MPTVHTRRWTETDTHQRWAQDRLARMLAFVRRSADPRGGFAYLGADGEPMLGREPSLLLTARMTHVAALGSVLGMPGAQVLLHHGLDSLAGPFHDDQHGGWFGSLGEPGTARTDRKTAYEHVHVILGASSAVAAARCGADVEATAGELLGEAVDVVAQRFWQDDEGALSESFGTAWDDPEPYRGANANMHAVEAFLAAGDVLDDDLWHQRALRICERLINTSARSREWLLAEHYDARWRELPDYNIDVPEHPFRPYGATYGHLLEWARLLCGLHASPRVATGDWVLEAADGLARSALSGWAADGHDGLVYTVDWNRRPVSTLRLHWPICEGIQACSLLGAATSDPFWENWYRRLWDHAARYFIDDSGAWINELDDRFAESGSVWPGRPDVYHAAGAYAAAWLPAWPFVTVAAALPH